MTTKTTNKALDKAKKLVGTTQDFKINHLTFAVKVVAVKSFVGRVQYQIAPVKGKGTDWVEKFSRNDKPLKK